VHPASTCSTKRCKSQTSGSMRSRPISDPTRRSPGRCSRWILHELRDRLPVPLAVHLGAELPLLVRGVYYDQFQPSKQPADWDRDEFIDEVQRWLSDIRPVNAEQAVRTVFAVLSRHVPPGQVAKVRDALPEKLRQSWASPDKATAGS
jgi:uncharacterized protein (DUF2267 family)